MTKGRGPCRLLLSSALIVSAALLATRGARAEEDVPVSLHWNVPADGSCPDSDAVLGQIRDLIGTSANGHRQPIDATANVKSLTANRWQLELTTRVDGVEGHRSLDGTSCQSMVDATSLILAWMIDPTAMAAHSFPLSPPLAPPTPPPPPSPPPVMTSAPRRPPVPRPVPRSAPKTFFALGTAVDLGTLPHFAIGIDAHLAFQPFDYAGAAARLSYFPRSVGTSSEPSTGGTFSLLTAGASLCAGPRVPLALCVGPEIDVMRGAGFGVRVDGEGTKAWLSLFAEGRARIPIVAHFGVVAMASLVVPSKRQTFVLDGVGPVHQPSAVAGRGALGLEVFF